MFALFSARISQFFNRVKFKFGLGLDPNKVSVSAGFDVDWELIPWCFTCDWYAPVVRNTSLPLCSPFELNCPFRKGDEVENTLSRPGLTYPVNRVIFYPRRYHD